MEKYLYILQQALVWILIVYWIYNIIIAFCALIKIKEKRLIINKKHKFMMVIPAHNEEIVIANLIESLNNLDYDKELYDVYVIADNCTDKTAKIAEEHGAKVYERHDEKRKTKGYALNWFLDKVLKENLDYDAFCVFDADNVVDSNFLNAMNKKLCQGETVVQGYKDIKNPTDSWISSGYALFYWTQHKFYHLARYNIGLSPLMNGTGFMVKFDVIKDTGWNTKTLTEDVEFSLLNIAKGNNLGWAVDAIVYDEQPTTFSQSWNQRTRWSKGHVQIFKYYIKDLAKGVAKNKTVASFDGLVYILCIPVFIISVLLMVVNFIMWLMQAMTFGKMITYLLGMLLLGYGVLAFSAIITLLLEKKPIKTMIKGVLTYPFFMATWSIINFVVFFGIKKNVKWDKIEHNKSVSIDEINEQKNAKRSKS
jgi:cellulose synthase/poly-beta-1,6-N-acetylglucosamine synthase-like glycosyltransferase